MAELERNTKETKIKVQLSLYGRGKSEIGTGVGFFDHMLDILARHSFMDLTVVAQGDIVIDSHHTVEDVGIVIGKCLAEELGARSGIRRFGSASVPLDEALASVSLDLGNRAHLSFDVDLPKVKLGDFDVEMTREFFQALANNAGMTLHVRYLAGDNLHHIIESIFKSFARALDEAKQKDPRLGDSVASTKGVL